MCGANLKWIHAATTGTACTSVQFGITLDETVDPANATAVASAITASIAAALSWDPTLVYTAVSGSQATVTISPDSSNLHFPLLELIWV